MNTDSLGRRRYRGFAPVPDTTIRRDTEWERDGEHRTVVMVKPKHARGSRYMEVRWLDQAGNLFSASSLAFERWAQGARMLARRVP